MARIAKSLYVLCIVAWLVGMASGVSVLSIEDAALSQPTGQYTQPIKTHGVKRYITVCQKRWHDGAHVGFLGCWLVAFGGIVYARRLKNST